MLIVLYMAVSADSICLKKLEVKLQFVMNVCDSIQTLKRLGKIAGTVLNVFRLLPQFAVLLIPIIRHHDIMLGP